MLTQIEEEEEKQAPPAAAMRPRGFIIGGILLVIVIAGVVALWLHGQTYESTDDAQIDGHLNPVSARIAGTIKAVYVEDNQYVEAGKPLLDLDTTDYDVTAAQTKAQFEQAEAQLGGERPNLPITQTTNNTDTATSKAELTNADAALSAAQHDYSSAMSQLAQAEANNAKAQSDLVRYKQLIDKHEVAQSEYDQYDAAAKAQAASEYSSIAPEEEKRKRSRTASPQAPMQTAPTATATNAGGSTSPSSRPRPRRGRSIACFSG